MPAFTVQSELAVSSESFWSAMSMDAVNWELAPLARMTVSPELRTVPIEQWQCGHTLFKSWILVLGFLPVDLHSFRLREIHRGRGFQEASSSWLNKVWNHERTTVGEGNRCLLIDRLEVAGRFPLLTALLMPIYKLVFRHRHRRLRRRYRRIKH